LLRNPPNMDEHKQATTQASFETASSIKLPTRVITYAWGDAYMEDLLSLTIPALLAPGNLPYLASQVSCEVVMLTEERLFARVSGHPAIRRLRAICPFKLIGLDDLISAPDKKYGMALTYALHRGFADLGTAMTDHWLIFLNADFVLAEGSLRNLLDHLVRGERLVASPSYCVVAKEVRPELLKWVDPNTRALSMPPREMAKLALAHRHNTIRSKTVNQSAFHIRYMDQFFWLADNSTLLGHQMPIAIVGLRPECYVAEPNSYWDHGLMKEFCPTVEPDVIGDSDDFLMIELREQDVAHDDILPGWPQPVELAERMISWVTPYQRSFARYPLTLHAADVPENVEEGRRMLAAFVNEVMSHVPTNLPSHLGHPQWVHHWTGFAAARYQFLSSRLGPLTETTEPPSYLSKIDKAWWKLDGQQKRLHRQREEYVETMNHQRDLIQKALLEEKQTGKQRKEIDREFLKDLTSAAVEFRSPDHDCFAQISFVPDIGAGLVENPAGPPAENQGFETLKRYQDKYSILHQKQRALEAALEAVNAYYPPRLHAINQELDRLKGEHLLLIGKIAAPRTFPFLRMRRGPSPAPTTIHGGSRAGRLARRFYHRLFGRWPRVSRISPYWIPLRHVRELTDHAAARGSMVTEHSGARGAQDVLYIGDRSNISGMLANLPGLHAWMSVAGLMTSGTGGTFAQPPQFDICLCDLEFADFARFSEIYAASLPFMRHGGTIIGFYLNADGAPLPIHQNEIGKDLQHISPARVYYAGSPRSAKLLRAFRSTLSIPRRLNVVFLAKIAIRLGLLAPQIWISNLVEGLASKKGHSTPGAVATSITTHIRLAEFPWDNGTVEAAKAGGLYVADEVEAPVEEDRLVAPSIANPPGTTVILTFGQSNAANTGEERYAAHGAVHVFNIFDMRFYRAIDPLPGASHDGGSVWGRLGDKLIDAGVASSVLIVPIAVGATYIRDWGPGGYYHRRLLFALHRLKSAGIKIDMLCWHQGEADANHTGMSAAEYSRYFRSMLRAVREKGVDAPVYVALATLCEEAPHPFQNAAEIRRGQKNAVSIRDRILPGPDTDLIGIEHRRDGCHFSASGQELAAQAWFKAITRGRLGRRMLWARYRLASMFAPSSPRERDASATRGG
jgi:carbohydrate esterase-like sialic acid-specific acetylesterase